MLVILSPINLIKPMMELIFGWNSYLDGTHLMSKCDSDYRLFSKLFMWANYDHHYLYGMR